MSELLSVVVLVIVGLALGSEALFLLAFLVIVHSAFSEKKGKA